jgi:hypothetical protein
MVLRPQGLIPERRRRLELTAQIAADDAQLAEAPAGEVTVILPPGEGTA